MRVKDLEEVEEAVGENAWTLRDDVVDNTFLIDEGASKGQVRWRELVSARSRRSANM